MTAPDKTNTYRGRTVRYSVFTGHVFFERECAFYQVNVYSDGSCQCWLTEQDYADNISKGWSVGGWAFV